ncbi:MAG: hypothetical protein OEZ51_12005 [Nitrospinota bacterium]|nr:hypothetical protein [Nitrospinota bacterium]
MDSLDDKIDGLMRDKLISLIQENVVRIKRTTIKYTKSNKKHTLEHWQAVFDSYGKVFRNMPREMMRIEKEVRIKFVSPLTDARIIRLQTLINSEVEMLLHKLTRECQPEFEKLGHGDDFERKVEEARAKLSEGLEQQIQKTLEAVNGENEPGKKLGVQDIMRIYDVKESTLHEINIISPLQSINSILAKVNGVTELKESLESLQEGFRSLFQDFQMNRVNDVATMEARKKLKMEIARDTMTVREIVLNTQPFLEQLILPEDRRNSEVVRKSWNNIFEILERQEGRWAPVIPKFKPLYNYMCGEQN